MKDAEWSPSHGSKYKAWVYYEPFRQDRRLRNIAVITVVGETDWQLHINHDYVTSFNSWAEARDATPMMIALYEQGRKR